MTQSKFTDDPFLSTLTLRQTETADTAAILEVQHAAFLREDVAGLTRDLLVDESGQPMVSLLAFFKQSPIGHILFTKARLVDADISFRVYILAPLAVVPDYQRRGVGALLIATGLDILKTMGVELVFVLGHPTYYPRSGFVPAFPLGFSAPYPIPKKDEDAWMVQALTPSGYGELRGAVACADALNKPEHWRE